MRGYFVSLEGVEGSGKSTQARRLVGGLEAAGIPVVAVREPGGTRVGEAIREILLSTEQHDLSPWAEANLFTAARAQLVKEVILPGLARGMIVVADRYADSTLAYQGAGRGLEVAVLGAMQAVLKLRPNLTFLLDVDPETGRRRQAEAGKRADRMEAEDLVFHRRVRQGYLDFARQANDQFVILDGATDEDALAADILRVTMERSAAHGIRPVAPQR